jgi:sulfatase maturation enzyme AslB (radical SAM superfamily)
MTSRHKFFLKLIKNPTDVEIVYNTNGTFLLDEETISLLKQYKNVEFIISIDGYKELNEQVRSGSKWESILEFINQIKRLKFNALIHSVLHINNWFGIVELSNFVNDIGLPWRTNVLTYPTHLDIINLSWDQKMKFIALLENVSIPVHEKYSTSSKEYIIKHLNVSK